MSTRREFLGVGTRRKFLVASSLATSAMTAGPLFASAADDQIPDLHFGLSQFKTAISRPASHRHVFAAGSISRGFIFSEIFNTFFTYEHWLGTTDSRILAVAVLYHGMAVALALEDAAWNELIWPNLQGLPSEAAADIRSMPGDSGNALLQRGPNGTAQQSIKALASRGVKFFVCFSALSGLASVLARELNRSPGDVYAQLTGRLISDATIVPTGVWAIQALQEARFTYLQTSL
jgi:intracellular sulfur oxidation DsrE/DsrF family protein